MALITTTRRYLFQSVHALNVGVHRERRHGHQYYLEVSFRPGAERGRVDDVVHKLLREHLHGHELSGELEPSTGEHLVDWIHARLSESPIGPSVVAVALQETRKNRFVSANTEARFV